MSVSAARRDHRSSSQYDVVNPIEHRTNLANAGTVHDGRFPHADEVVWRQLLFQVCQGFPQQVTVAGGVYAGIVSGGFDPQNVGNGNKENPLLVLYHKAFQRAETAEGLEQWFEISICFPALFEDLACVNQGLGKSHLIKRFQEIVNSVHFECENVEPSTGPAPVYIFVTAHDAHAIRGPLVTILSFALVLGELNPETFLRIR